MSLDKLSLDKSCEMAGMPADKDGLLLYAADAFGTLRRHFVPRDPGGTNDEDLLMMHSLFVYRLKQLGLIQVQP